MTRRLLLGALLSGAWITTAGRGLSVRVRSVLSSLAGAAEASASAALTPDEIETLVALAEPIVDGLPLPAAVRQDLAETIAAATRRNEGRRALYRATAARLDHLAAARFAGLALADRAALVHRHRLDVRTPGPAETAGTSSDDLRAARTQVVPDLIAAYWSSPAGWAAVGYEAFPGRCGELTRYTRPEA